MCIKRSLLTLLFVACALALAFAQEKTASVKSAETVQQDKLKTIFHYKKELGLSEKQVADMAGILTSFQKYLNDKGQEIKDLYLKLNSLIKQKAELKLIRQMLEQISAIQIDVSFSDIETSRKIEGVLSPSQLKKWNAMQEAFRKEEIQARQLQQLQKEQKNKP